MGEEIMSTFDCCSLYIIRQLNGDVRKIVGNLRQMESLVFLYDYKVTDIIEFIRWDCLERGYYKFK